MFSLSVPGEEPKPMCESCHESSLGKCAGCGELLRAGKYASVLGRKYHAGNGCISCIACRKPFDKGESMFQRDGFPVCSHHARGPLPAGAEDNMRRAGPAQLPPVPTAASGAIASASGRPAGV